MNVKNFLVDALTSALELGLATPEDVLEYVTPDTLGAHLPRPLWARVLTACVGAPRVDATLVVETIGVHNLCEHVPAHIMWGVIAKSAARSLGGVIPERPTYATLPSFEMKTPGPMPLAVSAPPPPETRPTPTTQAPPPGPSIPASIHPSALADAEADERPSRARTPTGQRFRQSSTGIGRLAATTTRRPQATAGSAEPTAPTSGRIPRRAETEVEMVESEPAPEVLAPAPVTDWRTSLAVEDDQLVDWSSSEETQTVTGDDSYRKR